jgi:hypothetical protein
MCKLTELKEPVKKENLLKVKEVATMLNITEKKVYKIKDEIGFIQDKGIKFELDNVIKYQSKIKLEGINENINKKIDDSIDFVKLIAVSGISNDDNSYNLKMEKHVKDILTKNNLSDVKITNTPITLADGITPNEFTNMITKADNECDLW